MSYLRKYARPKGDNLTRQYGAKLSDKDGDDFEAYCKELNLKPAEAVRFLILEELERVRSNQVISGDIVGYQKKSKVAKKQPEGYLEIPKGTDEDQRKTLETLDSPERYQAISKGEKKKSTSIQKKPKVSPRKSSGYLAQFKIDGKWPCPVCDKWVSAGHYKKRHAEKHARLNSEGFLRLHEEKALKMVEAYKKEEGE